MITVLANLDSPGRQLPINIRLFKNGNTKSFDFKSECLYVNLYSLSDYFDKDKADNFASRETEKTSFVRIDITIPDEIFNEINESFDEYQQGAITIYESEEDMKHSTFMDYQFKTAPIKNSDPSRRTNRFATIFIRESWLHYHPAGYSPYTSEKVYDIFKFARNQSIPLISSDNKPAIEYGMASCRKAWQEEAPDTNEDYFYEDEPIRKTFKDKIKSLISSNKKKTVAPEPEPPKTETVTPTASNDSSFFKVDSLKKLAGSKEPMKDLKKLIGLESVKEEVERFYAVSKFDKEFRTNLSVGSMHMCFMGNPGTGKTTVARIMTGILYEMGYIRRNECIEVNALQLCGNYVGQTGQITAQIIHEAKGGVLFIDEAYSLAFGGTSYGQEAVSVLLKEMEDCREDLVVILAGYSGPMNKFLDMNSGFRSRINHYFKFEDYSLYNLIDITVAMLKRKNLRPTESAMGIIVKVLELGLKKENFGNGRFVRNLVEKIEDNHTFYCPLEKPLKKMTKEDLQRIDTIDSVDIPEEVFAF